MVAQTKDAYKLFHDGTLALADISANGIRIDEELLQNNIDKVGRRIVHQEKRLKNDPVWERWQDKYGAAAKLTSRSQMAKVLTEMYPEAWREEDRTDKGALKADEETLSRIDLPFIQSYLKLQKLIKARSTYLKGIQSETDDGYLRPMFSLGLARTYRSSSDTPNFQNMPVRTGWVAELIRSCFRARRGRRIVELDFKGIEVSVAACYNHDPNLIAYVSDPKLDMHRDMAAEIYRCKIKQVDKKVRYCAKNRFVFPEFYGDWYLSCARALWESIQQMSLTLVDGTPMLDHLKSKGISRLGLCDPDKKPIPGTFEHHIKEVERHFWYDRFKVYQEWKDLWYQKYNRTGYVDLLTGFRVQGFMSRKDVINYPIQGSAFHCLLWSLIQLHKWTKRGSRKTLIIGQIHDSIIADVPDEEMDEFVGVAQTIMTKRLPNAWPWIIVPLVVEVEASPVDGNWFQKAPWKDA